MQLRRAAVALVLAVTAAAVTLAAGHDKGEPQPAPVAATTTDAPTALDVTFAQMMIVHHAQAVSMSKALLAKPGAPERIANIADFVAHDQQREIDEMNAWLQAWGYPAVDPGDPAVQKLHGGAGHGMMSAGQLHRLDRAAFPEAGKLYLTQMIEHHNGAITMATSLLRNEGNEFTHGVAKHVVNEQTAENDAMRALL
ncbi:DUF305 domain-containing protein [Actinoplanes sp. TFC3]|uniref:DUF305 domain-containing protein n=1 Tax=Actinoplanes sp. TFC3 TaxID=1710355 RepID=UPI0008373BCF|nr:DUF305 domain-containing protein [Actinoplanes sp. TFC3]